MDRLIELIAARQNPSVAGLDPRLEYIPDHIKQASYLKFGANLEGAADAVLCYNKALMEALAPVVPAVKLQVAYYELYSHFGMKALYETIRYAKELGLYVINDAKRNDIGPTMTAYAEAHLGEIEIKGARFRPFDADGLTVNAYLGTDGITPLLPICEALDRDIYVLLKTSNPSSGELQDRMLDGEAVYALMGRMTRRWGEGLIGKYGYSAVGAVIGATYPEQLSELRQKLPGVFFLIPGYGAQGGAVRELAAAFDDRGLGGLINSSRAIMCAWQKEPGCDPMDFAGAAAREAVRMQGELMSHLPPIRL